MFDSSVRFSQNVDLVIPRCATSCSGPYNHYCKGCDNNAKKPFGQYIWGIHKFDAIGEIFGITARKVNTGLMSHEIE